MAERAAFRIRAAAVLAVLLLLGPKPEDAPEHGHVQNTDYAWFTMNDGGYQLTVINLTDVKYYAWYRP